jgi:hypothetical protein
LGTHDFSGKLLNAYISGEKQFKYNWGTITPTGVSNSNWVNLFTTPEVRGFKFKLQATKRITNMVDTYDMEGNFVSYDVGKYIALYKIEYKPHSSPNWTIWNPNFYVDGSATVLLDYLPVDSYDVRITNLSKEASKWKNKAFYTTSLRGRVTVTDLQISDDQHLYLLIDAGEGPIGGISNIRIEGQSIEQYLAVEYDIRMGENEQTVIPWFQDDIIAQYPSQKVTNAGITYTTVRSDVEGWEIGFALPNLFKSIEGGIYQNTVTFNISYRLTGTSNWTSWGDFDITGKSLNTMYRSLKYPGPGETALTSGQYDIKITRISPEYTSSSAAGELTFYYINEIAHKPF